MLNLECKIQALPPIEARPDPANRKKATASTIRLAASGFLTITVPTNYLPRSHRKACNNMQMRIQLQTCTPGFGWPLYKAIPFYVGLHNDIAYGIFFDNTFRTNFDFAHERRNITSFWADGGEMNYYFFYGPEMSKVVRAYTDLTGTPEIPPLWALGFHQSKWSYFPETKVKKIAAKFRALKIPCDAIYLDIDYMDGFRCFTWDKKKFPDPKAMIQDLYKDGFKTVVMIDPGIKVDKDYWVYQEALKNDYFCKRGDGPLMRGKVWPGECSFPDFTTPEVRKWWAGLYKELMSETACWPSRAICALF